jgi:phage antirepressor YoqD-like protein
MSTSTLDLTSSVARVERDRLADRTDVLDKVGVLRTLPDDMHVTTDMVAAFYEVHVDAIRQTVHRNREELDDDGYRVVSRGEFESDIASLSNIDPKVRTVGLYPRRAVLRIGMLLRDSEVARRVRDHLLDAERPAFIIPSTFAEALRLAADEHEARELAEAKVAELEPKAELADTYLTAQGGARLVRQVAKTFGVKESDLRRFLVDDGLIYVRHSQCGEIQYDHYSQFAHHFLPRETVVDHQWGSCSHYTLMILPRGVELIGKRLRAKGLIA